MCSETVGGSRYADGRGSEQGDSIISPRAVVSIKLSETRKLADLRENEILQTCWLHKEVEMDRQQQKQFDPGGLVRRGSCLYWRAAHITAR